MPIYEYACRGCEHEFETLQKISEPPLVECPECGEAELRKKISAARFRLKGGGWYETDFKSGDKKNLAGEGSKDKDGGTAKDAAPASDSNGDKTPAAAKSGEATKSNGEKAKTSDAPAAKSSD